LGAKNNRGSGELIARMGLTPKKAKKALVTKAASGQKGKPEKQPRPRRQIRFSHGRGVISSHDNE